MGHALREARLRLRLTQDALGEIAGVGPQAVMRWELGHLEIPVGRRLQIVFGVRDVDPALANALAQSFEVVSPGPATASPPTDLDTRVDHAILRAAEAADVPPRAARAFAAHLFASLAALGASVDDARRLTDRGEHKGG